MIIKASQRGGAKALGVHLMNTHDNEHVTVHEVRGFLSQDVVGALKESYALSRGTKCTQHLFSVSFNPPADAEVSVGIFENAIDRIEDKHGLTGQPRVIVFHEKEGRRHAHAVWSRIDPETMTAKQLSFYKYKCREISKELYLEHDWKMPRGLADPREADPRNFSLEEWQECKRMGKNARDVKGQLQDCWAVSDSKAALEAAMAEKGYWLAKGDRRGHVAVTHEGDVISLSRYMGKKPKEIAARLGEADTSRSIEDTKAYIAEEMNPTFERLLRETKARHERDMRLLNTKCEAMVTRQRIEREHFQNQQQERWQQETQDRANRLNKGLRGLWDRLTGTRQRTLQENQKAAEKAKQRDQQERHELQQRQLQELQQLQRQIDTQRLKHDQTHTDLLRAQAKLKVRDRQQQSRLDQLGSNRQSHKATTWGRDFGMGI